MGYSIYIGQAEVDVDRENPKYGMRVTVNEVERDDAPQFENDFMTGKSNHRHPSYTAWHDFCEKAGIKDLFYDEKKGLIHEHPGYFLLTEAHHAQIKAALVAWNVKHPNTVPGFSKKRFAPFLQTPTTSFVMMTDATESDEFDYVKARLMWLEWWVRWALDNCSIPAIYNS